MGHSHLQKGKRSTLQRTSAALLSVASMLLYMQTPLTLVSSSMVIASAESAALTEALPELTDSFAVTAAAEEETTPDGAFTYTAGSDGVTIIKYTGTDPIVVIPETIDDKPVTAIAGYAFDGNTTITEVQLGQIRSLGRFVFRDCTKLKTITIPKTVTVGGEYGDGALEDSCVESVVFEEGIPGIPANICDGASKLKTVVIPESPDPEQPYEIGERAFAGTALTSVVIPDSVNKIGGYCFSGCTQLKSVTLSKSLTAIGRYAFRNCEQLKELTIPKTVTVGGEYGDGALEDSCVETLTIADGMETIPAYLSMNNKALRTLILPESVTTIEEYAFYGCSNLETVISDRDLFVFRNTSFEKCVKLGDQRFAVIDRTQTYLTAVSERADVRGVVNFKLRYQLTPAVAGDADDIRITLDLPESISLLQDSITSSNLDVSAFNNNQLTVTAPQGELRFSARVTEYGSSDVSAALHFWLKSSTWEQTIGTVHVECPELTFSVPDTVNTREVEVCGIAAKGREVSVYVNGQPAGTFTASEYTGKYRGIVTLPEGEDGTEYRLHAVSGEQTSPELTTICASRKPVVTEVDFSYNSSQTKDVTDVFTKGASPVITFNPSYPVSFEIEATNSDRIDRMFVTSTKGSETDYVEAFYNKESGTWITKDSFDGSQSYVPGSLNISILEKESGTISPAPVTDGSQKLQEMEQTFLDNSTAEITAENENSFLASVSAPGGSFKVYAGDKADGLYIGGVYQTAETIGQDPAKYGFTDTGVTSVADGKTVHYYTAHTDSSDITATICDGLGDVLGTAGDIWSGEAILQVIEGEHAGDVSFQIANAYITAGAGDVFDDCFGGSYSAIGTALSLGGDFMHYASEMQMAGGNQDLQDAASLLFALKCVNTICTGPVLEALSAECPVLLVLSPLIEYEIGSLLDSVDSYLMECIMNNEEFTLSGYLRFIIDPSGIVYEAVPSNRLSGAELTIYFKDPETGEEVQWNAADYEQSNPILSDSLGAYAWDVPEGSWKVVCAMEGYETMESEWLPVPPAQSGIDFAMVSREAPRLKSVEAAEGKLTVTFTKFMDIATVTEKSLLVANASGYTVTPQLYAEGDLYTDTFIVRGALPAKTKVTVTADCLSYAGTAGESMSMDAGGALALGNVNGDDTINASDASEVLLAAAKLGTGSASGLTPEQEAAADINGDHQINAKDALVILRYAAAVGVGREAVITDFI